MRIEIWVILIIGFLMYNTYHDGKYLKMLLTYKKYYTIAFYAVIGIGIILLMRRNPNNCKQLLSNANNVIKYMPIDKSSMALFTPIFDLTNNDNEKSPSFRSFSKNINTNTNKRSVSETKKKYVAANQEWKCGHCKSQLDHTFEIDHRIRLEYGGGNDVSNLVALCRNCHGKKTASENM